MPRPMAGNATEGLSGAVPYLASLALYRRWIRLRLEGLADDEAWHSIACEMPRAGRREMARTVVAGARGQEAVRLPLPVEGGASVLKRGRPEEWRVSLHGRWPAVHLGAIEAAYGATPFYQHVIPLLREEIAGVAAGDSFAGLTRRLHGVIAGVLDVERLLPALHRLQSESPDRLATLAREKSCDAYADISVIDVIFKKGPEAIFTLLG